MLQPFQNPADLTPTSCRDYRRLSCPSHPPDPFAICHPPRANSSSSSSSSFKRAGTQPIRYLHSNKNIAWIHPRKRRRCRRTQSRYSAWRSACPSAIAPKTKKQKEKKRKNTPACTSHQHHASALAVMHTNLSGVGLK